jgi:hypothetical protein
MKYEPLPTESGMSFYRTVLKGSPIYRLVMQDRDLVYLSRLYDFSTKALQLSEGRDLGPTHAQPRREMALGMVAAYHGVGEVADVYETAREHSIGFDDFNHKVRNYLNAYYRLAETGIFLQPDVGMTVEQLHQHIPGNAR